MDVSTSIDDVVMDDVVDPTPTAQLSAGPSQVQVQKLDKRDYAELNKLTVGAPALSKRLSDVCKEMKAEKTGVVEKEHDENDYFPPVKERPAKKSKPLPDWVEPVYNPEFTSTDFECQQAGLDTQVGEDRMCDPLSAGKLVTPAVTCSACAQLRVWPCRYECDGCEKTGARVATLAQLHDCIVAKEGENAADEQIAELGRTLKTADGMQQRVRASVCCNNMNCKLASAVESKEARAAANESDNQAANQSKGNIRYRSADDFEDCIHLIRNLKVKGLIDTDTVYSMVLDTANWTYWTKTRQIKSITVAKAFADMHESMGLSYGTSTLQDMLDDFARLPLNFITTVIVDHINDERTTDTYGMKKDRPWASIFDDLLKRSYPDPYTSLHCWIRVQAWVNGGCQQCPDTGRLLHTVNFRHPMRPDGRDLFKGARAFHGAMFPHMQRLAASPEKLPMRCSERGFEQSRDQTGYIGTQIAAAIIKGTKTIKGSKYDERRQVAQLMRFLEGSHAELVDTQVHQAKAGLEYMPACNSLDAANNCHVARRVSNFGRSMGWDVTYEAYARDGLSFTAHAKEVKDCGSLITLFLKDQRCAKRKQLGMEIVPAEQSNDNGTLRDKYPRDKLRIDILRRGLPTDIDPDEKFMPRFKRPRRGASSLFDETFVPIRDVASGMGLLVANPTTDDLSSADKNLDETITLRAIERMQTYHIDIRERMQDFAPALVPMEMINQVDAWKNAKELTEQMVRRTPEVVHALDLAAQDLVTFANYKSKFCPDKLTNLVESLKGFHDAVKRYRAPLPQPVLSRAFRRVPVYETGTTLNAPSVHLEKKEDGHCYKNYMRLVEDGLIDTETYTFENYRTLDAKHAILRGHIHRNICKKRWYDDLVTQVQLDKTNDMEPLKTWLADNKWSATVSETPPEPTTPFEEWLTNQQIQSACRFPDNDDLRRQHAMHLLRYHQQIISSATAKEVTAAKMAAKDRKKKHDDAYTRWAERTIKLDLEIKPSIGRWLYQDQKNEDGSLKYPEDELMMKYEADYTQEMEKRFAGSGAHTRERQRKRTLGLEESIYDGATRHAADMALYEQAKQMVADKAAKDAATKTAAYQESLTDAGREELQRLLNSDKGDANDDASDDGPSTPDDPQTSASALDAPIDEKEVPVASAREEDLANGTVFVFDPKEDYTALEGAALVRAREAWKANHKRMGGYPGPRDKNSGSASTSAPAKETKPKIKSKGKKRTRSENWLSKQDKPDDPESMMDLVEE